MFGRKKHTGIWKPRGGELVVESDLVDIDEITGGEEVQRPPHVSRNPVLTQAMGDVQFDFILTGTISDGHMARLDSALQMREGTES